MTKSRPSSASPRPQCRCGCVTCHAGAGSAMRSSASATPRAYPGTGNASRLAARLGGKAIAAKPLRRLASSLTGRSLSRAPSRTGAKDQEQAHRREDRVVFINSDARLIQFFLRFLAEAGVEPDDLICRVQIHESADVAAAQQFWLDITGLKPEQFRRPTLKRHNPKTVRKNTGDDYHGCLVVVVRRSLSLYRQIEGWASAEAMAGLEADAESSSGRSPRRIRRVSTRISNPAPGRRIRTSVYGHKTARPCQLDRPGKARSWTLAYRAGPGRVDSGDQRAETARTSSLGSRAAGGGELGQHGRDLSVHR